MGKPMTAAVKRALMFRIERSHGPEVCYRPVEFWTDEKVGEFMSMCVRAALKGVEAAMDAVMREVDCEEDFAGMGRYTWPERWELLEKKIRALFKEEA